MKKLCFYAMLLCGAVALSSACSDENKNNNGGGGGEEPTENVLTLGGNEYLVSNVLINYYGDYYETGDTERIYVVIHGVDLTLGIFLDILLPDGVTTLEAGTYTVGDEFLPNTILLEASGVANAQGEAYITGGTIEVSKSGNLYTVIFDLETEAGALTGTCKMEFAWVDESETDEGTENVVTFANNEYTIYEGTIGYYGDYYETGNTENIYLEVYDVNETLGIYLDILLPEGKTTLEPGTYTVGDELVPYTILRNESCGVETAQDTFLMTGGQIEVSKSGNLYTIVFNLQTEGGALTGTCTKEFAWTDGTDTPDATLSGNVSIGGESFPIIQGGMLYYPEYSDAQSANVVLDVTIDDYSQGLFFDIYTSPSSNALIAGTYTLADTFDPNTIYTGGRYDVAVDQNYLVSEITGGTLTVAQLGDTYTLTFNMPSTEGNITGTLTGTLEWAEVGPNSAAMRANRSSARHMRPSLTPKHTASKPFMYNFAPAKKAALR